MDIFGTKREPEILTENEFMQWIMFAGVGVLDKIKYFPGVAEKHAVAVNLGYYYGYAKAYLADFVRASTFLPGSISLLDSAAKQNKRLKGVSSKVGAISDRVGAHVLRQVNNNVQDPFGDMAAHYLRDLYNTKTIKAGQINSAAHNLMMLQGTLSTLLREALECEIVFQQEIP